MKRVVCSNLIKARKFGKQQLALTVPGYGGGPAGWMVAPNSEAKVHASINAAWKAGIRYFDTSPYYGFGRSEERLGAALKGRPREEYVISTKVGRTTSREASLAFDYSRDGVLRSIEESLARLGTEKLDIILIHDIDFYTHGSRQSAREREALDGAYPALANLKDEGVIDAIGLGVNEWQVCDAVSRRVPLDCVLLAGRHTLLEREAETAFFPRCLAEGIGVIIGGAYNSGILATGATEDAVYNYAPASEAVRARVMRLQRICAQYGVRLPVAALAFTLRHPAVTTAIPGIQSSDQLTDALDACGAGLPEAFWEDIDRETLPC